MERFLLERSPRRIAIFRALVLGDMLCAIPAIRALRATLPDAHVALIGLPSMADFARRYPRYIDAFIPFPGARGFPEQREADDGTDGALAGFLADMRARRFDLAIQLHGGGGRGNRLVRSFGAAATAGFHRCHPHDEPGRGLFVDWEAEAAEPRRYLALMERLGADPSAVADATLELPILPADRMEWTALARMHGLDDTPFVCLHPGARWSSRRWPVERFAAVGAALARRGARLVVTGAESERAIGRRLTGLLRNRDVVAVDLAGATSLGALAVLLQKARLLITNDTGISHVAAAVGAPSIVVASGSDVARWAPLDRRRHRVLAHDVACRPCMHRDCPIDHPCATGITVDDVVGAALDHPLVAPWLAPHRHAA